MMVVELVDLPRSAWGYAPPKRWQVVAAVVVVVVTSLLWGLL